MPPRAARERGEALGAARREVRDAASSQRVLNHARERIEATYDVHGYIDEKREALEKWAKYLAELRDGAAASSSSVYVSKGAERPVIEREW